MLHCYLKIVYYSVLIFHYGVDVVFKWVQFKRNVLDNSRFAGIPTNGDTATTIVLGLSIGVGNICSFAMAVVYGYYITFHWECIQKWRYRLLGRVSSDGESLLEYSDGDENRMPMCNRHYVRCELIISNIELYLKEGVQTVLPLMIYMHDTSVTIQREWFDIAFAVGIIVINMKLLACFITKLCGCGSGENSVDCEKTTCKCILCMLGCAGSLAFAILSIVYLTLTTK